MKRKLHWFFVTILWTMGILFGCQEDEIKSPECTQIATFYSTNVCSGEVAVDVEGTLLNVENFSDYTTIGDYGEGDSIRIDYTVIELAPDGLLCGVFVVADLIELSCFEKLD
jgi:hypothetical protein